MLASLTAYKVRPASIDPPAVRFETGTPSFEGQAGTLGTVDYLQWLGGVVSPQPPASRRAALIAAMEAIAAYEQELGTRLLEGLARINGARLYGPPTMAGRVPTFAFTLEGHAPAAVAAHLARQRIHAWSGHFYAVEPVRRLGLADQGGLVRVGLCHYSTMAEVEHLLKVLEAIGD
jgi:selenocysteine lyase/cysteine desulfurase